MAGVSTPKEFRRSTSPLIQPVHCVKPTKRAASSQPFWFLTRPIWGLYSTLETQEGFGYTVCPKVPLQMQAGVQICLMVKLYQRRTLQPPSSRTALWAFSSKAMRKAHLRPILISWYGNGRAIAVIWKSWMTKAVCLGCEQDQWGAGSGRHRQERR